MNAIFVTGAGTDVGKTFIMAGLARELRRQGRAVDAFKPVASGFDLERLADTDTGVLLAALGRGLTEAEADQISPWRFKAALSPDMAARAEGKAVDFDALVAFSREKIAQSRKAILIEGVGGVMAPLDDRHTVLDWMTALKLPVLLVTGSYLGTISHTLTALDVLARHGLQVASAIVSESHGSPVDLAATVGAIRRFAPEMEILGLPRPPEPAMFAILAARLGLGLDRP